MAANLQPSPRRLATFRNSVFDRFRHYRQGTRWDPVARARAAFGNPQLPLQGEPPLLETPGQGSAVLVQYAPMLRDRVDIDLLSRSGARKDKVPAKIVEAWESLQRPKKEFSLAGNRVVRYNRCLGWDGNGLAAAFSDVDGNRVTGRSWVAKMAFGDSEDVGYLEDEKDISKHTLVLLCYIPQEELAKSEHIVQLVDFNGDEPVSDDEDTEMPDMGNTGRRRSSGAEKRTRDDNDKPADPKRRRTASGKPPLPVIIMEMLEHGDLLHFIFKVRVHNETVPNTVLWRFFVWL
ncbi:Uu.00g041110.m01.CDS01 [Anthostomella pinea]|uniref:Uu.00g041110.m01.CDS01 n=1 Tax=Anthostomella pinea TaxID=933095 RepID=A0AAI8YE48_9PEZI|nr:Uu.00g041110.m01.CDS01 [Anthostomella pinea]